MPNFRDRNVKRKQLNASQNKKYNDDKSYWDNMKFREFMDQSIEVPMIVNNSQLSVDIPSQSQSQFLNPSSCLSLRFKIIMEPGPSGSTPSEFPLNIRDFISSASCSIGGMNMGKFYF
jgi:hypothetical protein